MVRRLQAAAAAAESIQGPPAELSDEWEQLDELADEWGDEAEGGRSAGQALSAAQIAALQREMTELSEFHALARSIVENSKGEVLLTALRRGFEAAAQARAGRAAGALHEKAVIFTESRRTQQYLADLLELLFTLRWRLE